MASLLSVLNLEKSFGARTLFSGVSFSIETGDRIGLIGPNGAGKSTLLSILAGKTSPDDGTLALQRGLRLGYLEQVSSFSKNATVLSTLLEGALHPDDGMALALAYELISKLSLDGSKPGCENIHSESLVENLSGGWKKRVALARELMKEPDLLLLDEPTNHLDVESILWLENLISRSAFATLTITHDRFFLQRVSNRILELDRRNPGGLLNVRGHYEDYLQAKQDLMNAQEKEESALKNTLRREQEWLHRGAMARSTKQKARIERAGDLAKQVSEIESRNISRTTVIEFSAEGNHPKKLVEAKHISKSVDGRFLFKNLDLKLSPRFKLGLLGPNGCGKSTLIRVLLGHEKPDSGEVFRSDKLNISFFEQNRESLNPETTVAKTLAPHGDQVIYRGSPIHIRGYLDRFLFSQAQMNMPVGRLSGGEQSRLLIARLMLQEGNLLVLDEPTNDLDLATLGILEDCLTEFEGAVILVTHDRFFLDRVATQILAFHPHIEGKTEVFSSLQQWEEWHERESEPSNVKEKPSDVPVKNSGVKKNKLSFKEQKELDSMETTISKLEKELETLGQTIQLPEVTSKPSKMTEMTQKMGKIQEEIDELYARWGELEKKKG